MCRYFTGKAFDYVIVGGGAAGLALAARLTEDSSKTVAVIEAGDSGEAVMERILVPASKSYHPFYRVIIAYLTCYLSKTVAYLNGEQSF